MDKPRNVYPSDASDEEWEFVVTYMTLMREDAPQREYSLRDVFDALRWLVKTGGQWLYLPGDFPAWQVVDRQARRWVTAGVFETIVLDVRELLRLEEDREVSPSPVILDAHTIRSTHRRAGHEPDMTGTNAAVDTLGHLLALTVTSANEQERAQVGELAERIQEVTGQTVTLAYADQAYTGGNSSRAARAKGIDLHVVKHTETKKGFVPLSTATGGGTTFGWLARFRRLARDYQRLTTTLASWNWLAFATLIHRRVMNLMTDSA